MPELGNPMTTLSEAERTRIAAAIAAAERGTAGEIVVMVAARSGAYRSLPPALALAGALIVPWPLILLTGLSATGSSWSSSSSPWRFSSASRRPPPSPACPAPCPASFRRARARAAAQHEFRARGLARTRGRTGVLIYVALAERYADVVTDIGVGAVPIPGGRCWTTSWRPCAATPWRKAWCGRWRRPARSWPRPPRRSPATPTSCRTG